MKCEYCFHRKVCQNIPCITECEHYCDDDRTITLPIINKECQDKIRSMQADGYCFVNSDFLKTLYSESAELARYKAEAPRNHGRKRK